MKASVRARRMARHHKRMKQSSKLNLVSLMDIFTILVFFLLVNSSDVEVLQSNKGITLPQSVAEQKPDVTLVVMVSSDDLMVGGRAIAKVPELLNGGNEIAALSEELQYQIKRRPELTVQEKKQGRAVTIMGDQSVPYKLLKRIMQTCVANDYRDISLAVSRVSRENSSESLPGVNSLEMQLQGLEG